MHPETNYKHCKFPKNRTAGGTIGPLIHAKFHPHWCNISQYHPLSNINTGTLHCTQCCQQSAGGTLWHRCRRE